MALAAFGVMLGCGNSHSQSTGVENLTALQGKTVGVVALDSVTSLELRYVFQEAGRLDSRALGGDVRYTEAPGDSLPELLRSGDLDVAVLPPQVTFSVRNERRYRVRARVAVAMRDITGVPVLSTALLMYRDEATSRPGALLEARRMLKQSLAYFRANEDDVLRAIVQDQSLDNEFVQWQLERQRVVLGDSSHGIQDELVALWGAAVATGDIAEAPRLEGTLLRDDTSTDAAQSRQTLSLAVIDDGGHRAALYALEQGLVSSDWVDLSVTYLSPSELVQAINAREYDIVEANPMLVATGKSSRLDLVVLSGGVEDLDSTLLYEYVSP